MAERAEGEAAARMLDEDLDIDLLAYPEQAYRLASERVAVGTSRRQAEVADTRRSAPALAQQPRPHARSGRKKNLS